MAIVCLTIFVPSQVDQFILSWSVEGIHPFSVSYNDVCSYLLKAHERWTDTGL